MCSTENKDFRYSRKPVSKLYVLENDQQYCEVNTILTQWAKTFKTISMVI